MIRPPRHGLEAAMGAQGKDHIGRDETLDL